MNNNPETSNANKYVGPVCVFLASLLFSIGGLCIKMIPWSALAINGARNLIGSMVIGIYLLISGHRIKISVPVLIGALSTMSVTTLFAIANKMTTAANAIVLQFTAPVFVIILMAVIFHSKPKRLDIVTCIAVFSGICIFFIDGLKTGNIAGDLIAVLSGVCYAGVFMMNTAEKADAISSCFLGELAAGIIFTPFCLKETDFSATVLWWVFVLGVFQVGIAYILFSHGIRRTGAVAGSLIAGIEPIMNPIWVAVFYGEKISKLAAVGAVVVVGAIIIYNVMSVKKDSASA